VPARPARGLRLAPLASALAVALAGGAAAAGPIPTPIGVGPLYHPGAKQLAAGPGCTSGPRYGVHLELFAAAPVAGHGVIWVGLGASVAALALGAVAVVVVVLLAQGTPGR